MSEKIPKGWKWLKVEDFAEVVSGGTPSTDKPEFWNGDIAWITPKDLSDFKFRYIRRGERNISRKGLESSNAKLLPKGTVLLSSRAPVGYLAIAKNELSTNQGFQSLVPKENVITEYLYYLLKDNIEYLKSQASGTTFGELSKSTLKKLLFLLPPLPEQKAIAEVLSSIDDKIDLLHRQNKTLEEMAMTLFRKCFIEPTKDELPEGWEEVELKDIYFLEKGIEPGSKNYLETPSIDSIRFIRVGDMLDNKANVYIQKDLVGNSICKFDDLLVSFDGTVGRVSFGLEGCYSSGIRKIYSKDEIYNKLWLKHQIFISEEIQDEMNMHAEGTTILHASSSIDYLSFAFPLKEKIEEYDKFFDPIYKKMLHNKKSIQTLEKLRDTLLPKLMSGEVMVKF